VVLEGELGAAIFYWWLRAHHMPVIDKGESMKKMMKVSVVGLLALIMGVAFTLSTQAATAKTKVVIVNACKNDLANIKIEYKKDGADKTTTFSLARAKNTTIYVDRDTRVFAKYGNNKVKSVGASGKFTRFALTD
jgi:hypothetical protein